MTSAVTLNVSNSSTGGQVSSFNPVADTSVRGGTYASQNFGTSTFPEEKNSSLDSYDQRAFPRPEPSMIRSEKSGPERRSSRMDLSTKKIIRSKHSSFTERINGA